MDQREMEQLAALIDKVAAEVLESELPDDCCEFAGVYIRLCNLRRDIRFDRDRFYRERKETQAD